MYTEYDCTTDLSRLPRGDRGDVFEGEVIRFDVGSVPRVFMKLSCLLRQSLCRSKLYLPLLLTNILGCDLDLRSVHTVKRRLVRHE